MAEEPTKDVRLELVGVVNADLSFGPLNEGSVRRIRQHPRQVKEELGDGAARERRGVRHGRGGDTGR